MKRILGTTVAAVLAAAVGLIASVGTATSAAADGPEVVAPSEFFGVTQGDSLDRVRGVFGTDGTVIDRKDPPGYRGDSLTVEFLTPAVDGFVEVRFLRRSSGAWYLVTKDVYWGNTATRTEDKAREAEFFQVKPGNTISYVRGTFGTDGTIAKYFDAPGNADDRVVVEWPTASVDGWVRISFTKTGAGVWKVAARAASWAVAPERTADTVTEAEFDRIRAENPIDLVRSTFGTAGTIDSYDDPPGTTGDRVTIGWPTESPEGLVQIHFDKDANGVWRVESRSAHWGRTATPTADAATQADFESLAVGRTLAIVREAFDTPGTVTSQWDGPWVAEDRLEVAWFTGPDTRDLTITFVVGRTGAWTIGDVDSITGPWPVDAARHEVREAD